MHKEIIILIASAISVGFIHTLLGPDHYVPFIVMAKARQWSARKTVWITTLCGIGHVLSAVFLGLIAITFGITLTKLNIIESFRGEIAAWALICFGFVYFVWGLRQIYKNKPHTHVHLHSDGSMHQHEHQHKVEHAHVHTKKNMKELTPWVLFIIFILGPCEPLIPLIIYPAMKGELFSIFLVTVFFGLATLWVMLAMTLVSVFGAKFLKFNFLEKYANAIAGVVICGSGMAIKMLGL